MPAKSTMQERIFRWSDVNQSSQCWEWIGCKEKDGYGRVNAEIDGTRETLAHRASYRTFVGQIPDDKEIDHICKNRCCVNPAHLRPLTHLENVARGDYSTTHRNKVKTHCKRGHALSGKNLLMEIGKSGPARKCRACRSLMQRIRLGKA